jgi:hypothetical protein
MFKDVMKDYLIPYGVIKVLLHNMNVQIGIIIIIIKRESDEM